MRTSDPLAVVPEVNPPVVVTKSANRRLVRDSPEVMLHPTRTVPAESETASGKKMFGEVLRM